MKKGDIRKFVLQNAVKFNGKANPGAIVGKLISEDPGIKDKLKDLMKDIQKIVKEVNKMDVDDQLAELKKLAPELLEKKKEKKGLTKIPNAVKGKMVTRIAPEPSKYNHIGHALSFLINYLYTKEYNGKCILRFEDTNPDLAAKEYVDAMQEDILNFLDIKVNKTVFASDDMDIFYNYAQELIEEGYAFVCFCSRESMQTYRQEKLECNCREKDPDTNMEEWKRMLAKKYEPGESVLRLKGDMSSDNQVMRDPVLMRLNYSKHWKQGTKYGVWPMYDFENAIEDSIMKVTHILRSNEFGNMRIELQDKIKELLGLPKQTVIQYGRFELPGMTTKGREIRSLIEKGDIKGWDDPRLVTIRALKRRGILKETFYQLVYEVGLSAAPTHIDWTLISSINRRMLDKKAMRYFFIWDAVPITVKGAPPLNIQLDLHPEKKKGGRKLKTDEKFYITRDDFETIRDGDLYRLMDCLNFRKSGKNFTFVSTELDDYKKQGKLIMHWLPKSDKLEKCSILMDDGTTMEGLAEPGVRNIKQGEIIQFERFAFCRLDSKKGLKFWFTHK